MFLKKLFRFRKDYSHFLEKGDRFFSEERFADARDAYGEALERLEGGSENDATLIESIRSKHRETGNHLGRLNLTEAEHAVRSGEVDKAKEHLRMVLELAGDGELRKRCEELLSEMSNGQDRVTPVETGHSCGTCRKGEGEAHHDGHESDERIAMEDRLELYFHSLPEDLPERYAGLGDKFARGCLLNLEGDRKGALRLFDELSAEEDNDILDYEKAIIYYHGGETVECEKYLLKGVARNARNPLCYIALVHLYIDTGRVSQALPVIDGMLALDLIPDQARLLRGDLCSMLHDDKGAIESYSQVLSSPRLQKEAAGRLIPLLEKEGRSKEAAYLAKRFAKGCS